MAMPSIRVQVFQAAPTDVDWADVLRQLDKLKSPGRTLERGQGKKLLAVAFPRRDTLGLWSIRHGSGLDIHDGGTIRPWDLPADVAEGAYFRFFPNGIVTTARKGYGPGTTALAAYLDALGLADVIFNPVLREHTGDYVASIDDARAVILSVDTQAGLEVLRDADQSLGEAFGSLMGASDGTRIKVEIGGNDADEKAHMWQKVGNAFRNLAESDRLSAMRTVRIRVPGEIGGSEELDLLKDRIAFQIPVEPTGLTQANAHNVLQGAYDRFREQYGDR